MLPSSPAFTRPATPASKCFHLMRLQPLTTRGELVAATGLSQPTVTRAVTALIKAGLVIERNDLTHSKGRGRPTIPLELTDIKGVFAGITVGTRSTYIALFDTHGRTLRDSDTATPMAELTADDFIQHVMAGLNRLLTGVARPLISVGVTFPGNVSDEGIVNAPSLGWVEVDVAEPFRRQFNIPVAVAGAVPAILGAELQTSETDLSGPATPMLALFADDSVGAATSGDTRVHHLELAGATVAELSTAGLVSAARELGSRATTLREVLADSTAGIRALLDKRARNLGRLAADLITQHQPATVVVAGSAFVDDQQAPRLFAQSVRQQLGADAQVELRMIPSHRDVVRAISRAIALDCLIQEPIELVS